MANKEVYKCGICGAEYNNIPDRMNCERNCFEKQREEAKRIAEAKKKAEKERRQAEVDKAIKDVSQLIENFIKDYGSYEYEGEVINNYFHRLFPLWF